MLFPLLLAVLLGALFPAAAQPDWLGAPGGRSTLDTLLGPPGRPLGGRDAEQDPALSPDGRWLAYSSFVDGNWDIWLRDLQAGPGERPRRLTRHVAVDRRPRFAADGAAILFISEREDAAGDIWEIPLSRWRGGRTGEARPVLRRPGAQDHPVRDGAGALYWDEESPGGRRVMRWDGRTTVRELARPASLPRPGHGGLYLLSLADSLEMVVEWLPDSLLGQARPATRRSQVWRPSSALLDMMPGPEGGLWAITLEDGAVRRPGEELATPSQLWLVKPGAGQPPRPLLEQGRAPRQLSVAGRRLVYTEDERPALLWLEEAEGRFPLGGGGFDDATGGRSAGTWLELARHHEGRELGLPLLQTIQAAWPGSPAADEAALREMRLRMAAGGEPGLLLARLDELRGWMKGPEARARLAAMALELELRRQAASDAAPLEELARRCREEGLPGAAAEAQLARARFELDAGRLERALGALLDLETLPDTLAERADGLALKVRAYERLGESEAARGALARLAMDHADRPELLADWLRRDLAALEGLSDARARLRLRERLAVLDAIPPLRLALTVELARREAAAGRDGRLVAREDLRLALEEAPAALVPFQRRAWTQGQGLLADLRRQDGQLDEALAALRGADDALAAVEEPALAGILRLRRINWLLERAATAVAAADWEAAEADARLALALDPAESRAWRLRLEALARLDRLDEVELILRQGRANEGRGGPPLRGEALRRRAVETWALGLLLSWRAESQPAHLPESDLLLEEALDLDDRLAAACLTLSWNLSREIHLAAGRRGGLKGLLRELGRGREAVSRLRHRGVGRLEDPDEESMRDRAILLAQRGMRWTDPARDPDLAAALATNLGNLYFSLGEFGAPQACQAWEHRLSISPRFRRPEEQLRFLINLGTARQWSGNLEQAARDLDSAQVLAARLGLQPERRELLARLSMLAGERGRPVEAQAWLRQSLALESDPGQRAILWRNLAIIQMELGDEEAPASLNQAAREAQEGPWPMEPAQNWLRVQLLGLSVPLWNFPGLYTGQGRLDWGAAEEEALRQSLLDDLSGRQGAVDLRLRGLHDRRRLLRRQKDVDGMLRLDLAIARELAVLGRWEEAVRRCEETARAARSAVLGGIEARAVESALSFHLLARPTSEQDAKALARLDASAPRLRHAMGQLLEGRTVPLTAEQRLRLELLRIQDLDEQAGRAGPVDGLLLRSRALLLLEDLEGWRRSAGLTWSRRQRLAVDLAWARLLTGTGDAAAARERLAAWPVEELPPEAALLTVWARLQSSLALGRADEAVEETTALRRILLDLPAEPDGLASVRRAAVVLDGLDHLAARAGGSAAAESAAWRAWWEGRRLWEQADPPFPAQSWTNAWGNLRADLAERDRALEKHWADPGAPGEVRRADSLLAATRQDMRQREDRLRLWLEPTPDAAAAWPAWREEGLSWVGVQDSLGPWLLAAPEVHRVCRTATVLAADEAAVVGGGSRLRPPTAARRVPAAALLDPTAAGLDARVLALDGVLRLVPGAPHAAWLDFDGHRIALRELMALDLPGELLVLGEVDWQSAHPADWREGWLILERLLAQTGLRQALVPEPGRGQHGAPLEDFALTLLADSQVGVPEGWWRIGAPLLSPTERRAGQRQGMEELVQLGNEYRRRGEHDAAWRSYRRALRLALQVEDQESAGRLFRLGAASALDGSRPGEALDVLLEALGRTEGAHIDWVRLSPRLVQLADLAGRPAAADSLWRRLIVEQRPPAGGGEEAAPPAPAAAVRAAFEDRLLALERRGGRERAAALAREARLMPEGEDPRRALFLARLYLDTEAARLAWDCLQTPELRWAALDSLESLEAHELRSIIALRLGNLIDARLWMERAALLAASSDLPAGRLALHLQRQADLAWSLGQYGECAAFLDRAEAALPADDLQLALLLANTRGLLATELEEAAAADAHFARAQELGVVLQDPLELSAVYNNISRLHQRGGRWAEALEDCRRALEQDSLSGSRRRALVTQRNRAAALRGLLAPDLRLPEAWTALPEGLLRQRRASGELSRLERELVRGMAAAAALGEEREACRLELELALLRLDLGNPGQALLAAQSCAVRASRLFFRREALEARLAAGRALVRLKRLPAAEELLQSALAEAEEETARLAPVRFDPGRGLLQRLITDELVALYGSERPWEALAASERGRNLGLQEMVVRRSGDSRLAAPRGKADLQKLLRASLEPDQALLGWHVGRDRAWGFLWQSGELRCWPLDVARDSLGILAGLHRGRILAFLSPEGTGRRLAHWLLPPAWQTAPPRRVWLLPQGELHGLAFESLVLADGRWWGETTAICRSGSLAELAYSAGLPGGTSPGAVWSDPHVPGMDALEYTALEVAELGRLHPAARLAVGAKATPADLRGDGAARRFRHFACHAVHDPRSPAESALLLSPAPGSDGRLAAPTIAALDLPAGLTVLSACETALGRGGEEASAGLPRAFMAAGSRGVLASLWKVDDLSTAVLVKHLYRGLAEGRPADLALQEAQQAVRRWVHPHPAHWAAFCLTGQPLPEPRVVTGR